MAEDLWMIAQQRLEPFAVSPGVRMQLRDALRDAQYRFDIHPARWSEARNNIGLFIDTMGEIAVEQHQFSLNEEVYLAARSRLCPLFPIC